MNAECEAYGRKGETVTTEGSIYAKLSAVEAAAKNLNQAWNSLNVVLTAVESRLVVANVGLEVWLHEPLPAAGFVDQRTGVLPKQYLGFAKVNGKWALAVSTVAPNEPIESMTQAVIAALSQATLLSNAPREVRMAALQQLPRLLDELQVHSERIVRTIGAATTAVGHVPRTPVPPATLVPPALLRPPVLPPAYVPPALPMPPVPLPPFGRRRRLPPPPKPQGQ